MQINLLAVIVSALAAFLIGMFWYSNVGFGKIWIKLTGMTESDMKKAKEQGMAGTMLVALITWLVMAYVLAHFVALAGATTAVMGAQIGFWIWLGFVATVSMGGVLWERKPAKLWALNNAYNLLVLIVMGIILTLWQ